MSSTASLSLDAYLNSSGKISVSFVGTNGQAYGATVNDIYGLSGNRNAASGTIVGQMDGSEANFAVPVSFTTALEIEANSLFTSTTGNNYFQNTGETNNLYEDWGSATTSYGMLPPYNGVYAGTVYLPYSPS